MGIMNWFKKKKDVESIYEEAQENDSEQETVQSDPFHIIKEESGGCCGGGSKESSGGCGSGGCGSHETEMSGGCEDTGGGCGSGACSTTPTSMMLTQVTPETTLREAGQNPAVLEIMLKSGLPFGCGMKHLSIQEAAQYAGLKNPTVKKLIVDINQKLGNKTTKQNTVRAHRNRPTISGARNLQNSRTPAGGGGKKSAKGKTAKAGAKNKK